MNPKNILKRLLGTSSPDGFRYQPRIDLATGKRLLFFRRMMDLARQVPGDLVECGVGHGHGLALMSFLAEEEGRNLWGFDSFEGFPDPSREDASIRNPQRGQFATDLKSVHKILLEAGHSAEFVRSRVTLVKGFFAESLPKYTGQQIALIHIDADLYQSYLDVFNGLWPKLASGAVMIFDEYMNTMEHYKWPGAKKAIDEFLGPKGIAVQRDALHGGYYAVKP